MRQRPGASSARLPKIRYRFRGNASSIADYLRRNPTTGLLIAKDDTILFEHYQYARTDRDRLLSQSTAKTITSMLIGIAIGDGAIKSVDDPVSAYVPGLADAEYGKTPLRALLHMSSGVEFREVYDGRDTSPSSAASSSCRAEGARSPASRNLIRALSRRAPRGTTPASRPRSWAWRCARPPASRSPIISPRRSGSRSAPRPTHPGGSTPPGKKWTYCCFNAVLRDYARLGRLLAYDGAWEGRQLIPRNG